MNEIRTKGYPKRVTWNAKKLTDFCIGFKSSCDIRV